MSDFRIEIGEYTGPLDLLLYLTKVNEVDITDIPIAVITNQFLRYIDLMEMLNMDLGADFLVMASTLMEIKSRTLVPVEDMDDEEEEVFGGFAGYGMGIPERHALDSQVIGKICCI